MADLLGSIRKKDLASALDVDEDKITDLHVAPARVDVPGFSSLVLRVDITLQQGTRCSFIAKRLPVSGSLFEVVSETDIFTRETNFFLQALPKLLSRVSPLPVVKCFAVKPDCILLEDLSAKGYKIVIKSMDDIGRKDISFDYINLVIKQLARFHAASLDIDWLQLLPDLNTDAMLEKSSNPFPKIFKKGCEAYANIINYFYPEMDTKYSQWLRSSKPIENLLKLIKPDKKYQNVLNHADLWLNNILFLENSDTGLPEDAIFIDFQMYRFAPCSRDIANLLYTCTSKTFRNQYETQLNKTYVYSFNEALGYEQLTLEDLTHEYNDGKLFGLFMAIVFRSMNLMSDLYPKSGQIMSSDMFECLMSGRHFDSLIQRCKQDTLLSITVQEIIDELIQVLDQRGSFV